MLTLVGDPFTKEVYDTWAAANLPPGDRSFAGDANQDGVANGWEFAYGPLPNPFDVLEMRVMNGQPTAVLVAEPNNNGSTYTQLGMEATRDLHDWTQGAVPLQESEVEGHRQWTPMTTESNLFFRAKLSLLPE